jgi:LemA protein
MKRTLIAIAVLAIAGFGAAGLQSVRGELMTEKDAIRRAWVRVDSALIERSAAIPELIRNLGPAAPEERRILEELAAARSALESGQGAEARIEANAYVDGAMGKLLVALESRPGGATRPEYQRMRDELAAAEDAIAVERRKYNEAVQKYNTSIELFPGNLAASIFGFTRNDAYFKTEPTGRRAPAANK